MSRHRSQSRSGFLWNAYGSRLLALLSRQILRIHRYIFLPRQKKIRSCIVVTSDTSYDHATLRVSQSLHFTILGKNTLLCTFLHIFLFIFCLQTYLFCPKPTNLCPKLTNLCRNPHHFVQKLYFHQF